MNTLTNIADTHVERIEPLISPAELRREFPMPAHAQQIVIDGRRAIEKILQGHDDRLMVIVGPCSIHHPDEALTYADSLAELAKRVEKHILVVMRCYFEKPRTTLGWKGLINDPHLKDMPDINTGLRLARKFLLDVAQKDLPTATEFLESYTPQYISDLICLGAIGARTTESPAHRQLASGLSMPVGFKNGTDGSVQIAVDAMTAAAAKHSFYGIDDEGRASIVHTRGNPSSFVILRGGRTGSNYHAEAITDAVQKITKTTQSPRLVVDCSHANSDKDYRKQAGVFSNLLQQRLAGNAAIVGAMIESNLHEGSQSLSKTEPPKAGVSITDGCIGWEETERLILAANEKLECGV